MQAIAERPKQRFELSSTVKTPRGKAIVAGVEWGPDNLKCGKKSSTWLYWLKYDPRSEWVPVSEQELIQWQS